MSTRTWSTPSGAPMSARGGTGSFSSSANNADGAHALSSTGSQPQQPSSSSSAPPNPTSMLTSLSSTGGGGGGGGGGNAGAGGPGSPSSGAGMMFSSSSGSTLPAGAGVNGTSVGTIHELDELHRKYRVMELTRKQSNEESANTLRMQRQQIEKLKKDNERLKEDLALETRQARQANNATATAQIAKLQDQGDIYTRKIDHEKRRLDDLDKQISKMQSTILVQRKEMGGINATRESNTGVQKQIRILENRLDKALVKFNEALAHNKNLREQIDNLRRERIVFDGIYNKLNRELSKKKWDMNEIMQEANRAYDQRNTAQSEMIHLKEHADREQELFEHEWKHLGHLIDKDRKMKDFVNKNQERESAARGGAVPAGQMVLSQSKSVDPAVSEEHALRKQVTKGAWGIATDKANIHLSMEKVQSYEEAFAKIQKATRITDIDELVHTFVHAEDTNFSLFNYVNDLSNEIESVEDQLTLVREQLARYKGGAASGAGNLGASIGASTTSTALTIAGSAGVAAGSTPSAGSGAGAAQSENNDGARKRLLADLESKLVRNSAQASRAEASFLDSSKVLGSLKSGVGHIFARLGCGSREASEMLGNAGVTESNMMQYLAIIEQRTNELIGLYHAHQDEEGERRRGNELEGGMMSRDEDRSRPLTGSDPTRLGVPGHVGRRDSNVAAASSSSLFVPSSSEPLTIRAPSAIGDDDDDDDDADDDTYGRRTAAGADGDDDDNDESTNNGVRPLSREELMKQQAEKLAQQDEY